MKPSIILALGLVGTVTNLCAADAPTLRNPAKVRDTNWIYTSVTNIVGGNPDPRFGKLIREGWQIHSYEDGAAWVGGADRPARQIIYFRKRPK
jgi:hypothetical protein